MKRAKMWSVTGIPKKIRANEAINKVANTSNWSAYIKINVIIEEPIMRWGVIDSRKDKSELK